MALVKITFEDHGQDFLEWVVNTDNGMVLSCAPFQQAAWVGKLVDRGQTFCAGGKIKLKDGKEVSYPIAAVEYIKPLKEGQQVDWPGALPKNDTVTGVWNVDGVYWYKFRKMDCKYSECQLQEMGVI